MVEHYNEEASGEPQEMESATQEHKTNKIVKTEDIWPEILRPMRHPFSPFEVNLN